MELYLLKSMSIILLTAVVILLLFNKLKLPSMIGLFITGIILGQFISSADTISTISELGVIFLLFIIGLEFSIEKFSSIKKYILLGGILQVLITTGIITVTSLILGLPFNQGLFIGLLVSFSSTAIVIKMLQERQQTNSIQGKVILGILIFQDIAVILVLLLTPILGGSSIELQYIPITMIEFIIFVIGIAICTEVIIPKILHMAAYTKNRDLFLIITLLICLGTTYLTSNLGLSSEIGAFIAGLMISKTEFSHQTLGYVQPFQDLFMSLFFISIGLMLDMNFFINNILLIVLLAMGILLIKILSTGITMGLLKLPMRIIVTVSILLSQVGEFSFVVATDGMKYGLMTKETFNLFLAISIITMSMTPVLQKLLPKLINMVDNTKLSSMGDNQINEEDIIEKELEDHTILVGFGINGRNISEACKNYNIPHIIIDMNPVIVEKEKKQGRHIIYGDATQENILEEVNISKAKAIIIATSDYRGSLKSVDAARRLNPSIHIIVRTRYIKNVDQLYELGANEVIPEEFETSIIMFTRIMDYYNKDINEISTSINDLRSDNYNTFRCVSTEDIISTLDNKSTNVQIDSIIVTEEELLLDYYKFNDYNLTVTSIIRKNKTILDISNTTQLKKNDVIVFTGNSENITTFHKLRTQLI